MKKLLLLLVCVPLIVYPQNDLSSDKIDKGLILAQQGKFNMAVELLEPLAIGKNAEAQYWLFMFYGPSGLNNKKLCKEWLEKAIENESRDAQFYIANLNKTELKNPENYKKWLYMAASNGHPQAQYDLAWSMSAGWFNADISTLIEVIYWFEKAGHNGITKAYANLAVFYDDESAEEDGHLKVLMEMERFANNGNAMAQYNMGWIYARGLLKSEELMQDLKIAKMWFEKSASSGFKDAIDILKSNF